MADWLTTKMKGKYRLLAEYDESTHDFPRDSDGGICDSVGVYISCKNANKIYAYGKDGHREMQLCAYIPSLKRGRNIVKKLDKLGVPYHDYDETDEEVTFRFSSNDIDVIAELLGAKTNGASISPFSIKNLPKSDIKLPDEELQKYKDITAKLHDGDWLIINSINKRFMDEVLAKKLRPPKTRKLFDYRSDMKKLMLSRDQKAYIWKRGLFDEYLSYLDAAINDYYNDKQ